MGFLDRLDEVASECDVCEQLELRHSFSFSVMGPAGDCVEVSTFTKDAPGVYSFLGIYHPVKQEEK